MRVKYIHPMEGVKTLQTSELKIDNRHSEPVYKTDDGRKIYAKSIMGIHGDTVVYVRKDGSFMSGTFSTWGDGEPEGLVMPKRSMARAGGYKKPKWERIYQIEDY